MSVIYTVYSREQELIYAIKGNEKKTNPLARGTILPAPNRWQNNFHLTEIVCLKKVLQEIETILFYYLKLDSAEY